MPKAFLEQAAIVNGKVAEPGEVELTKEQIDSFTERGIIKPVAKTEPKKD